MPDLGLDVPVVFIIFNRPEKARAVFDVIAAARPQQLFVIADGPRPGRTDDVTGCAQTRSLIEQISWDCDLHIEISAVNLGCGRRIASGLDWVFEQVDRAIVLEDDCVPHPSFFLFCRELLDRYAEDERIRTIGGNNYLMGRARNDWSYHFSRLPAMHGWATWRRSWQRVDMSMRLWPEIRDTSWLIDVFGSKQMAAFWAPRFDRTYHGEVSSYSYPYLFSCWIDHALAVTPNVNLVRNIGFGTDATNTKFVADFCKQGVEEIRFPMVHPPFVACDGLADAETFKRRLLPEQGPWLRQVARGLYHLATGRGASRVKIHRASCLPKRPALG